MKEQTKLTLFSVIGIADSGASGCCHRGCVLFDDLKIIRADF